MVGTADVIERYAESRRTWIALKVDGTTGQRSVWDYGVMFRSQAEALEWLDEMLEYSAPAA